jgi:hypothetical protein
MSWRHLPISHLTQSAYEESLLDNQINELSKGKKTNNTPNKYNLRSKKKEGKYKILDQPSREYKPTKDAANRSKENKTQNPLPIAKYHVLEVRQILKPPSSFSFEHEIKKIRILVPLSELIKHEDFKKSLSKLLQSDSSCHFIASVNL